MIILGIETSCDETAISIIRAEGDPKKPETLSFEVLADNVLSQIKIHKKYGGVFPMIAKREHAKALVPLFKETLKEAGLYKETKNILSEKIKENVNKILEREAEMSQDFLNIIPTIFKPQIDAIAVTRGPGLEPALWVGINFAKALSFVWGIPVVPTNHMEGHIVSALSEQVEWANKKASEQAKNSAQITFPALALLISGGHTELVLVKNWADYQVVGRTKDDAVGEAFDKVARMLDLPYPGGPEISKLAKIEREKNPDKKPVYNLPKPMIHSKDFNFSFSGLKTSILYTLKKINDINDEVKQTMSKEFEDVVVDVLISKTSKAQKEYGAESIIIGGGVSANARIRESFEKWAKENNLKLFIPEKSLSTDNALMIAMAGYIQKQIGNNPVDNSDFKAHGNWSVED